MRWSWFIWDALAILAFTLIGMHFHKTPFTLPDMGRTLVPFYLGWFGLAFALGLYRERTTRWAFPLVWVLGVLIGVLLRAWVFTGRGVSLLSISPTFLLFSLLFIGLFTGLPRLIVHLIRRAQQGRQLGQS